MSSPYCKGFPARYRATTLAECQGDGWLAHYHDVSQLIHGGGIAVLVGQPGTGKTRMATEIAGRMQPRFITVSGMKQSQPCLYYTADRLLTALRDSFSGAADAKSEACQQDAIANATLLVIDEIDGCIKTDYGSRKFKAVVDERYQRKLPTILITNCPKNQLASLFPPQVVDRIKEDGKGFYFDWPSFREKGLAIAE